MACASDVCSTLAHQLDKKIRTEDVFSDEQISFSALCLSESVYQGLLKCGFISPSPIQLKAIPLGRCGLDLIVQAKSGTGKTIVFSTISLESVMVNSPAVQVLILAPTREIAVQNWEVISAIASEIPELQPYTFIGGLPLSEDRKKLKKCHIALGTPGRVKQLIEEGLLVPDSIRLFILDEADKLLEESMAETVNWIFSRLPQQKQMLALSATYPSVLADQLALYMRNPTVVRLNVADPALLGVSQYFVFVPFHPLPVKMFTNKVAKLVHILSVVQFSQCLVFSNYQSQAQSLCERLKSQGWPVTYIGGMMDQQSRLIALAKLKTHQCRILVSTDLTARGIDAENVNLVINLDMPLDVATYLHRIGRAGRYGSLGAAITLLSQSSEVERMQKVEIAGNAKVFQLPDPIPANLTSARYSDQSNYCVSICDAKLPETTDQQSVTNDDKSQALNGHTALNLNFASESSTTISNTIAETNNCSTAEKQSNNTILSSVKETSVLSYNISSSDSVTEKPVFDIPSLHSVIVENNAPSNFADLLLSYKEFDNSANIDNFQKDAEKIQEKETEALEQFGLKLERVTPQIENLIAYVKHKCTAIMSEAQHVQLSSTSSSNSENLRVDEEKRFLGAKVDLKNSWRKERLVSSYDEESDCNSVLSYSFKRMRELDPERLDKGKLTDAFRTKVSLADSEDTVGTEGDDASSRSMPVRPELLATMDGLNRYAGAQTTKKEHMQFEKETSDKGKRLTDFDFKEAGLSDSASFPTRLVGDKSPSVMHERKSSIKNLPMNAHARRSIGSVDVAGLKLGEDYVKKLRARQNSVENVNLNINNRPQDTWRQNNVASDLNESSNESLSENSDESSSESLTSDSEDNELHSDSEPLTENDFMSPGGDTSKNNVMSDWTNSYYYNYKWHEQCAEHYRMLYEGAHNLEQLSNIAVSQAQYIAHMSRWNYR